MQCARPVSLLKKSHGNRNTQINGELRKTPPLDRGGFFPAALKNFLKNCDLGLDKALILAYNKIIKRGTPQEVAR